MFTGIVEETGIVESLIQSGGGYHLRVRGKTVLEGLKLGDSIAVNGTCLTVTRFDASGFTVGLSPETLRRTNLGELRSGSKVNLERALRPTDRMGGHFVQGHVDGVATVTERRREADALAIRFKVPEDLSRYIVEKGFIAVDGISLTVTACGEGWFEVTLIPFTQQMVTLGEKGVGDKVNIEVDIISKYVESFLARRESRRGITADFLAEQGFV
ncbi:MAG: riboflavin synthase [Chloroflexota bacterium]|jgi:riboflavin synthase